VSIVWKALLVALLITAPTAVGALPGLDDASPLGAPPREPLALNETTVEAGQVPAFSLVGLNFTVTWDVSLQANESASNISETAVYWDTLTHGPGPFDRAQYPNSVPGSPNGGTSYTADLGALAPAGPLHLVLFANVSGVGIYNDTERVVDVRTPPNLSLNAAQSDNAILYGRSANLTVDAQWPYLDTMSSIRLLWDLVPHGTNGTNATDYPNAAPGQGGPTGNYTFVLTPGTAGNVYFTFGADVLGATTLASSEYVLAVAGEPLIIRDSAPPWVVEGSSATVQWSVLVESFINYTTELRFDSVSHPAPRGPTDYPSIAGTTSRSGAGTFEATIVAPAGPAVYFYLVAYVDGYHFTVTDLSGERVEFAIEVRPLPVLQMGRAPAFGFVGRNVTVEMRVIWPYADPLADLSIHYDNSSQGTTPTLPLTYTSSVPLSGVQAGTYNFTMGARASAGLLFYTFHAEVGGVHTLSALEHVVMVVEPPTVQVAGPPWSLVSAIFTADVTVAWGEASVLDEVWIYYDQVSGAPDFDHSQYSGSDSVLLEPAGDTPFVLQAPASPGPLYLFAAVVTEGELFVAAAEAVVDVAGGPVIDPPVLEPATGFALHGQNMTVMWRVNFTHTATVSSDFRWDTQSHLSAGGFDYLDYPNASPLFSGETGETVTAFFDAPNETTVVYGIVRAVLEGRNYYTDAEVTIQVVPRPVVELVSFPESVETDEAIEIRWRIGFQGDPALIPHTAVHWGLESAVGLPVSFTNYPRVGGPFRGNATNLFNATVPAQPTPGAVYFVVHAVVNGQSVYLGEETVEVRLPGEGSGGGFLPGFDATAALIAGGFAAAALAATGRRRRA
jgi:hypothetical protein